MSKVIQIGTQRGAVPCMEQSGPGGHALLHWGACLDLSAGLGVCGWQSQEEEERQGGMEARPMGRAPEEETGGTPFLSSGRRIWNSRQKWQ